MKDLGFFNIGALQPDDRHNFDNRVMLLRLCGNKWANANVLPVRVPVMTFFIVEEGFVEIELDYNRHLVDKNSLFVILPEHIIQGLQVSENFKGRSLLIEQIYFGKIGANKDRIYQPSFFSIRRNPVFALSDEEVGAIYSVWDRIIEKIHRQDYQLKDEIIKILLSEYLLEVDNMMLGRGYTPAVSSLSRQEELLSGFLRLLRENAIKEHRVTFYADRLRITTQHLSLILRQLTGRSTREWIANTILAEAKIMLKHSGKSVEQIADALNFQDSSTFCKFFKNITGTTPARYRKQ